MSQTGKLAFIIFNVNIKKLQICLTHLPRAVHYFQNTVESLTEMIFLS